MADPLADMLQSAVGSSDPASVSKDDPLLMAVQHAVNAPANDQGHPAAPQNVPIPHAAPTPFQKAAQPPQNMSWGDTLSSALQNLPGSIGGVLSSTGHALAHPLETAGNIGQLASGAASQAAGALGVQQDPAAKAQREALLDALESHYKQTYGSMPGFKNALANDPASIGMDAATVLGGGAGALKAVGMTGKLAETAGRLGSVLDPIQSSVNLAKGVAKLPAYVVRGTQSTLTGAPFKAMELASKAGSTSDPVLKSAFLDQFTGKAPQTDIANTALDGMQQIKANNAAKFGATKQGIYAANPGTMPFDKIDAAQQSAQAAMNPGNLPTSAAFLPQTKQALAQADQLIADWKADPAKQTMENFDALRVGLGDILDDYKSNSLVQKYVGSLYHATRGTMQDVSPEYTQTLEDTTKANRELNDLQKTLGLGRNVAATSSVAKQLRALKTANGTDLLSQLAVVKPELPYMLAGAALSPWRPGGLIGTLEGTAGAVGMGSMIANPAAIPATLATAAGTAALSSPKIAGALNYGAGKIAGLAGRAASSPVTSAAYYSGRAPEAADVGTDPVFGRLLNQESGNHQFDRSGNPVRSSKGAIGAAQIMPGTGPEAAAAAGLPWDRNRLETDAGYNIALGKAYFRKLLQTFNGDTTKATAAYNAGPGNVNNAIRTGTMRGDSWINHLPSETQHYVHSIIGPTAAATGGRIERASGGKVGHEHLVQRLMKLAEDAKKATDNQTKPLLKQDDSTIANALAIAQKAI